MNHLKYLNLNFSELTDTEFQNCVYDNNPLFLGLIFTFVLFSHDLFREGEQIVYLCLRRACIALFGYISVQFVIGFDV